VSVLSVLLSVYAVVAVIEALFDRVLCICTKVLISSGTLGDSSKVLTATLI